MAELSPLRRRMIEDMTVRNLSPASQRSYIYAVAKFSQYFGCSPDRLDMEAVRTNQVQLVARGIPWPALNQTRLCTALLLRRDDGSERAAETHLVCSRATQAAAGAERGRGRALSRSAARSPATCRPLAPQPSS